MSDAALRQIADDVLEFRVDTAEDAQNIARFLRAQDHWQEVVAGLTSVSVLFDPEMMTIADAERALQSASSAAPDMRNEEFDLVRIPVRYGGEYGPDLADVCQALGIGEDQFIAAHTSAQHAIDMIGFTPGFAYISGLDASLSVPRRAAPRPRLPAGSVGISGLYTGLYALAGPGGWPIIGRTEMTLFDPQADDPFALRPGQHVKFEAI